MTMLPVRLLSLLVFALLLIALAAPKAQAGPLCKFFGHRHAQRAASRDLAAKTAVSFQVCPCQTAPAAPVAQAIQTIGETGPVILGPGPVVAPIRPVSPIPQQMPAKPACPDGKCPLPQKKATTADPSIPGLI